MRDDFAAFVLSYGRPDNVLTLKTLKRQGYTGRLYVVVDDSDPTLAAYVAAFGDRLLVFSKDEIAARFDQGDNFTDRRSVFYARNACWELARQVGARYFVQLDDDYKDFRYRHIVQRRHPEMIRNLDGVFEAMVRFVASTPVATLAMSQGGDHIGDVTGESLVRLTRKAMNSFVCDVERPFAFRGRINEDVNTYVSLGHVGELFFTYWTVQLDQTLTQQASGGMTELYLDSGTYLKSFYTVLYAPSCVHIEYQTALRRLHHKIAWDDAVPKLLREHLRRNA